MFDMSGMTEAFGMEGADISLEKKVEECVIEDIIVVNAGRKNKLTVPEGYEKVGGDLNEGAGGDYIYFCVKRGSDKSKAINGLKIVMGKNASAPAGYQKLNEDLNKGAGGQYIYLCVKRGSENPIHDIRVVSSKSAGVKAPDGYTMLNEDLNKGAGGRYIYLCYA